jgi:PAS domain S-box-containing protein
LRRAGSDAILAAMLSSELVRSVLDSAPDAMIIIDSAGKIVFANRQVEALFGHQPSDVIGHTVEMLLPQRFRQRHLGHRTGYTDNVRVRPMGAGLELFGMRRDGSEFPVEISLSPIGKQSETLVAAAIRDVTARKQTEQALRDARREAEHANLAKSRFLATASHDLRQPLQSLSLLNGALRRMIRDEDSADALAQQEQAIDAMSRLLNALLDISKLESGAITVAPAVFEIGMLFDDMRREFGALAASHNLAFSIDSSQECVHSDPALIGQVLRNLLSNAIKYTPKGRVELRCERHGDQVRIEVRDSGVGIAADQVPLIFEEFYQVGVSPNSSRDGYGLGLSIVNRIARILGLAISVDSKPGRGSAFSFVLPAASRETAPRARNETPLVVADPGADRGEILLVEDEPGVRAAMKMLLDLDGYRVTLAATAQQAFDRLQRGEHFDLLITDYHLDAGRTGTQVIAKARELNGDAMKAILVTGDTSSAIRDIECDANLRITSKPINSSVLLALVKNLIAG